MSETIDKGDMRVLSRLCEEAFGESPVGATRLPASGGDRVYYRLDIPNRNVLGVVADNLREAEAYVRLSDCFENVPEVFAHTPDYSHYLVRDIGLVSLFDRLHAPGIEALMKRVLETLVIMQTVPEDKWGKAVAYPPLSARLIKWDLNYFKYEFLKNCDVAFDEELLEDDFEALTDDILSVSESQWGFMMRDCQSRNVMLGGPGDDRPYFIDFQGGRKGPLVYDAVSFLWQAKAGFSREFREGMLDYYARRLAEARGIDSHDIISNAPVFALFRTLQVLGAYGFRGLVQKRAHFIESIPGALANLSELVGDGALDKYPELRRIAGNLVGLPMFQASKNVGPLVVKVFSFSYKRGYPADYTGNGGGFMFDCRGMHNPGRYDEYKPLTGRDEPVKAFLREQGEADVFATKAVELVAPTIERYIKRGFSSLQIGFGCTGGRHRSVYCADLAARRIAELFPEAEVELVHREQDIHEWFNRAKDCPTEN